MKEFKGTKGVWSFEEDFDQKYDQQTCKVNSSVGIEGICTVWSGNDKMTDECIADAALISAAPDLFEALQEILRFNNELKTVMGKSLASPRNFLKALEQGKLAINKALGL